ncbi:MAG: hypothetical protein ACOCW4_02065 [bacterium]
MTVLPHCQYTTLRKTIPDSQLIKTYFIPDDLRPSRKRDGNTDEQERDFKEKKGV